jgi:hypothetical protein
MNLEKLRKTAAQARDSNRSNDHPTLSHDQSQNVADEIHCTKMEIFALEMAKSECINRVCFINYYLDLIQHVFSLHLVKLYRLTLLKTN